MRTRLSILSLCSALLATTALAQQRYPNPSGLSASVNISGPTAPKGAFFQSFGSNGRSCATCHLPEDGWGLSARSAQRLFDQTAGLHPLFAFDGKNCPLGDEELATVEQRRSASSIMLELAAIRFERDIPAGAEFELIAAEGTSCNTVGGNKLVVFRRSPPTTNFETTTVALSDGLGSALAPELRDAFKIISAFATMLHAETPTPPPDAAVDEMVKLMQSLRTAQVYDSSARNLDAYQGLGGSAQLASLPISGPAGFDLFDAWSGAHGGAVNEARAAVARGQELFNARCAGCHDSPNRGNSVNPRFSDLGLTSPERTPAQLPMYTLRNRATGAVRETSDPGAALVSGRWADIGKFKVPNLRALAARAPYFHNGFAATLEEVVEFYDERFDMNLSAAERSDLVKFLRAL